MRPLPAAALGAALLVVAMHLEGLVAGVFLPPGPAAAGFRAARAEALPLYALVGAIGGPLAALLLSAASRRLLAGRPEAAVGRVVRLLFPHLLLAPLVVAAVLAGDRDWLSLSLLGGVAFAASGVGALPPRWGARLALAATLLSVAAPALVLPRPERVDPPRASGAASTNAPDVVLVVLDTVRRDRLSVYGGPVPTPSLERLASQGARLEAVAASPWSVPSHVSLFTGLVPSRHGVEADRLGVPESLPLLAERFRQAGWATAGFSANPWVTPDTGLGRGFGHWREAGAAILFESRLVLLRVLGESPFGARDKGGRELLAAFDAWLDERDRVRPSFAFVNFTEAHAPYARIPRSTRRAGGVDTAAARRASLRILEAQHHAVPLDPAEVPEAERLYAAAVQEADALLGRLLDRLDADPRGASAVVAVVSDHGEMLGEHGQWGHTVGLHRAVLEVPFLLRAPGVPAGSRPEGLVGLVDVAPTLLAAAGLPPSGEPDGRALLGPEGLRLPVRPRGLSAELGVPRLMVDALRVQGRSEEAAALELSRSTVLRPPFRYERDSRGGQALYDLASDPDERHDLAADPARAGLVSELAAALAEWTSGRPPADAAAPELSEERKERLRSLGYAQ